jgi:hypothetical protein
VRNLLALLAAFCLTVLVAGYFLNWYTFVGIESHGGNHRLQIDVNTEKIKEDLRRGKEKLRQTWEELQDVSDQTKTPAELPAWPKSSTGSKNPQDKAQPAASDSDLPF